MPCVIDIHSIHFFMFASKLPLAVLESTKFGGSMKAFLILGLSLISQVGFSRTIELSYCGQKGMHKSVEVCTGTEAVIVRKKEVIRHYIVLAHLQKVRGKLKMIPFKAIKATKPKATSMPLGVARTHLVGTEKMKIDKDIFKVVHTLRGSRVVYPNAPINGTYEIYDEKSGVTEEHEVKLKKVSKIIDL